MNKNPYENVALYSQQDYEFFAGVVMSKLLKVAKPATRQMTIHQIFNTLKDDISYDELCQIEKNIKDLYNAKKQAETQSAPIETAKSKKAVPV